MNIDLTDEEAAALTKELHDIIQNDRYPFSPRIQTLKSDPRQTQTGAGPRALAAAKGICAASIECRPEAMVRAPLKTGGPRAASNQTGGKSMPETAKVFEDRLTPGDWRVEWEDEDGGVEVTIFSGPDARERAIQYADWQYRQFVELPQRSG
jgi:hypothetical protein